MSRPKKPHRKKLHHHRKGAPAGEIRMGGKRTVSPRPGKNINSAREKGHRGEKFSTIQLRRKGGEKTKNRTAKNLSGRIGKRRSPKQNSGKQSRCSVPEGKGGQGGGEGVGFEVQECDGPGFSKGNSNISTFFAGAEGRKKKGQERWLSAGRKK